MFNKLMTSLREYQKNLDKYENLITDFLIMNKIVVHDVDIKLNTDSRFNDCILTVISREIPWAVLKDFLMSYDYYFPTIKIVDVEKEYVPPDFVGFVEHPVYQYSFRKKIIY